MKNNNFKKSIELTKKQFRELLLSVIIGTYIREAVAELKDEELDSIGDLEDYIMSFAKDFDSEDMVEKMEEEILIPSDKVCKEYHDEIIEEYDNDEFWTRLARDLGQRDFYRTMSNEEKKFIQKNNGWLPERIHKIYKWYEDEFEKNGLENIKIISEKDQN